MVRNEVTKFRRSLVRRLFASLIGLLLVSGLSRAVNDHTVAITVPKYVRLSLSHTDLPVTLPDSAVSGSSTVEVPTALNVTVKSNCGLSATVKATNFLPDTPGNTDDIPGSYLQALISRTASGSTFPKGWFQITSSSGVYRVEGPMNETFVVKYRLTGNYSGLLPDTYRSTVTYTLAPI